MKLSTAQMIRGLPAGEAEQIARTVRAGGVFHGLLATFYDRHLLGRRLSDPPEPAPEPTPESAGEPDGE